MSKVYMDATKVFKELRELEWVHPSLSRRKATKAIVRVLNLDSEGDRKVPPSKFPYISPLLSSNKTYNSKYINQAFGVLRYLRGDYIGK